MSNKFSCVGYMYSPSTHIDPEPKTLSHVDQAGSGRFICFGLSGRSMYLLRKERANSFTTRELSSALITKQVSNHNEGSESSFTTTPLARQSRAVGFVRMATPTCSDTR